MRASVCAAIAVLVALAVPARAQQIVPGAAFYTLADLQAIFVRNQQYFAFDTEGTSSLQLNHLHFTRLDTTTGDFEGVLVGVTLPEDFNVGQQSVPVTGTITITPGTDINFSTGNFYGITFSWALTPVCGGLGASFTAAMTFQGYEGSGKMHAVIAGLENAYSDHCAIGQATFNPVPFSGQLTK